LKGKTAISILKVFGNLKKCEAQLNLKKIRRRLEMSKKKLTAVLDSESSSEEDDKDSEI